jgi:polysaccharide deacetylase family sporulation protein PdaB
VGSCEHRFTWVVVSVKWGFYNLKWVKGFLVALAVLVVYPAVSGWSGGPARMVAAVSGTPRLLPIYAVDTTEKKVAISFDATWGAELTPTILDILDRYEIKTTFFLCGYWVDKFPEVVREIAARGHELGNHTATHPHLNSLSREGTKEELASVHEQIKALTGQESFLFRPPYGEYSNKVIEAAQELGYYTIQWSVDSLDWQNPGPDAIASRVIRQIHPGAIVLFHNAAEGTPPALPHIIETLQAEGYKIVPISHLIYRDNYYMDHRGFQKRRGSGGP